MTLSGDEAGAVPRLIRRVFWAPWKFVKRDMAGGSDGERMARQDWKWISIIARLKAVERIGVIRNRRTRPGGAPEATKGRFEASTGVLG